MVDGLLQMLPITPPGQRMLRVVKPSKPGDPYVVLLLVPRPKGTSYTLYRKMRRNFLEACCRVVRLDFPDAVDIIGLATETADSAEGGSSEDAIYVDGRDWSAQMLEDTQDLKKKWNILTSAKMSEGTVHDYPD